MPSLLPAHQVLGGPNDSFLSMASASDGHYVVAFDDGTAVRAQLFNADGSARGGEITVNQAGFTHGIGATVEQDESLMVHPQFGLFAEPATTVLVSTDASQIGAIEELADNYGFNVARIGTTGGDRLEIKIYGDTFVSASIEELRTIWAKSLEATLHDEVTA